MKANRLSLGIVCFLAILIVCLPLARANAAEIIFEEDFEAGWGLWYADNGVWQVGEPTAGPPSAHGGVQCAGTILGGDYPSDTDSRLVSPSITLPDAAAGEEIYLRFWQCFSYAGGAGCDFGRVQISVWDEGIGEWSSWGDIGNIIADYSPWSKMGIDLTAYAGESVRIAFSHSAVGSYPCASSSTGWYIDDIDFPGISPVIDDIIFDEYAPPPVTSMITVAAHDPVGGNLSYNWNALDGGEIIGQGSEVDFAPPENIQFCPYRVRVAVCSDLTHICSARIIGVYTRLPGDANGDGYVNTKDQKQVRNHFGESGTPGWVNADVNCDGFVNTKDQKQVRNYFGQSAP